MTTVPPEVSRVAVATGEALPVAFVSLVIAFAVAVPPDEAPNAVADRLRVATAVPGAPTVPVSRNFSFPDAPINAVTASVAALRAAVLCVVAIFFLGGLDVPDQFNLFRLASGSARDLKNDPQLCRLAL